MEQLRAYYSQYGVDLDEAISSSNSTATANRFIRLNPRFDAKETLKMIQVRRWMNC